MKVLPEKRTEVVRTILSMSGPMEKEPGCRSYLLLYDLKEHNLLSVSEKRENREGM